MFRFLIEFITRFICWIKRKRIIKPKYQIVKINIGSGLATAPGWINIDASLNAFFSKWPSLFLKIFYNISKSKRWCSQEEYYDILKNNLFIHHDVRYGIPLVSESCDHIYMSHFLDYLFKEDAKKFLKEVYRVLKKGGLIRVCVLDLEYPISLYQQGHKERALSFFFETFKPVYLSCRQYMYDFELLRTALEETGFANIERCLYRQGKTPNIDVLDNRPEQTLYVEASKL